MKHIPILILTVLAGRAAAQDDVLDLTDPHNYSQQAVPEYITKDNTPPDNPITDMRIWSSVPVTADAVGEVSADFAASASDTACYYRVVYAPGGGAIGVE